MPRCPALGMDKWTVISHWIAPFLSYYLALKRNSFRVPNDFSTLTTRHSPSPLFFPYQIIIKFFFFFAVLACPCRLWVVNRKKIRHTTLLFFWPARSATRTTTKIAISDGLALSAHFWTFALIDFLRWKHGRKTEPPPTFSSSYIQVPPNRKPKDCLALPHNGNTKQTKKKKEQTGRKRLKSKSCVICHLVVPYKTN